LAFSGYKAREYERAQGGRGKNLGERKGGDRESQNRGERRRETEPGKILVHQPAAPRAFTTIVSVLNGEDQTEN